MGWGLRAMQKNLPSVTMRKITNGMGPRSTQNYVPLIALALLAGEVAEDLSLRYEGVKGALVNAILGSVVEHVLAAAALRNHLFEVIYMSLIASIITNLVLVFGGSPAIHLVSNPAFHLRL